MDNTIIVLYGDHGQHLGEKHHFRKQALWEESTRVPLFFRIPGAMDEGKSSHTPVSLLDIYPTLLKACQLPANEKNQGTDLSPIIRDVSIRAKSRYSSAGITRTLQCEANTGATSATATEAKSCTTIATTQANTSTLPPMPDTTTLESGTATTSPPK